MKILNIVGKVDTRPLVYPLARALALKGQTAILTDDGAYRRLYHGLTNIGTVSGVDIGVCEHVTGQNVGLLTSTGINYDFLIIVGTDYISPKPDGLLVCHGVDCSVMATGDDEAKDDDLIFIEGLAKRLAENNQEKTEGQTPTRGKSKKAAEEAPAEPVKTQEEIEAEEAAALEEAKNKDKIIVPHGIPFVECQVGFSPVPKNGIIGISLRDGHMQYVYNCEENKQLLINGDKNLNTLLSKVAETLLGIDSKEMGILLTKDETTPEGKKGKK